jgi:hypothetical protein
MKLLMFASLQTAVDTPEIWVRSSLYARIPRIGFPSSLAHWISHFSPLEASEF